MAVYLGTKCMFFTYFFLELFPYTQGENALTGYAWDTAVVFFSCSLWYNWYVHLFRSVPFCSVLFCSVLFCSVGVVTKLAELIFLICFYHHR